MLRTATDIQALLAEAMGVVRNADRGGMDTVDHAFEVDGLLGLVVDRLRGIRQAISILRPVVDIGHVRVVAEHAQLAVVVAAAAVQAQHVVTTVALGRGIHHLASRLRARVVDRGIRHRGLDRHAHRIAARKVRRRYLTAIISTVCRTSSFYRHRNGTDRGVGRRSTGIVHGVESSAAL